MNEILAGIKWHDVACHHEKPIICEDEPGHLRSSSKLINMIIAFSCPGETWPDKKTKTIQKTPSKRIYETKTNRGHRKLTMNIISHYCNVFSHHVNLYLWHVVFSIVINIFQLLLFLGLSWVANELSISCVSWLSISGKDIICICDFAVVKFFRQIYSDTLA